MTTSIVPDSCKHKYYVLIKYHLIVGRDDLCPYKSKR